jgi:valyl-tRNA synthetase
MNLILTTAEGHKFCNKIWNVVKYVDILMAKVEETRSNVTAYERSDAVS